MEIHGRGDRHRDPPVAKQPVEFIIGTAGGRMHQALVIMHARRFQYRVVLDRILRYEIIQSIVELRGVTVSETIIEFGAMPLTQEGIRAISMLLGGEQCAGRRTRSITSYLRGTAAGLRRYNGQITAVGTVMGDAVDGDAWCLDDVHVDILHHAQNVVHLIDFKNFF